MDYEIGVKCGSDIRGEKLIIPANNSMSQLPLEKIRLFVHLNRPFSVGSRSKIPKKSSIP